MWLTVVFSLLAAWVVLSVPLAFLVARAISGPQVRTPQPVRVPAHRAQHRADLAA